MWKVEYDYLKVEERLRKSKRIWWGEKEKSVKEGKLGE
jgi:hypothetical protein